MIAAKQQRGTHRNVEEVSLEEVELATDLPDVAAVSELDVGVTVDDGSQGRLVRLALCKRVVEARQAVSLRNEV
jgi:hypothetical protein